MTGPQVPRQHCRSVVISLIYQLVFLMPWVTPAFGQSQRISGTAAGVPHWVRFSGTAKDGQGNPRSGLLGITFALYKEEQGGSPLWVETQNVQVDPTGRYTVNLGATKSEGLPQGLFVTGEAHWLGVQVEGQAEQLRTLLLSVPYALKAGDAETVGGLPPSAFVLASPNSASSSSRASGNSSSDNVSQPPVGGSGTQNFIPLWTDNSGTLGNSVVFQSGTGSSAKTGVNTTTPAATLDVNGAVISRGALQLPSTGTATAGAGFNSEPLLLQGSSFNSSSQQAIGPVFQWQTEPSGNNTSNPAGTLNLLYSNGGGQPGETGLNIANNGRITFATGQTFPGTGTITGVTAGTGLTGGGTSGNVTLSINVSFANQHYAQLGAPNTFAANQTVNANLSAKQLISTSAQGTAPLQVTSTTVVPNLNASLLGGLSASAFQPAGSYATLGANTFNGDQSVTGNVNATASVNAGTGFNLAGIAFAFGDSSNLNAFLGFAGNSTNTGQGNTASGWHALHSNTSGGSNTASGARALSANTAGSENTASGGFALYQNTTGSDDTATGMQTLYSNIGGNSNSAAGAYALHFNTTGSNNTGDGSQALYNNTVGFQNTASGGMALLNNVGGINNTALGFNAGPDTSSPNLTNATAIGANAVVSASNALVLGGTGPNAVNVGIGTATPSSTLDVRGTGNFTGLVAFAPGQTFPGTGTITGVTSGTDLIGGGSSGNVTLNVDTTKVVTGITAGTDLTGGGIGGMQTLSLDTTKVPQLNTSNTFTGNQTMNGNLTATGVVTGSSYQIGSNIFAFGSLPLTDAFLGFAGNPNSMGVDNTAIGPFALASTTTGGVNTAIGGEALGANTTGGSNTAAGFGALAFNTTGSLNTAMGLTALSGGTGDRNTAFGADALAGTTNGEENTAVGLQALFFNQTGSDNTALGYNAGPNSGNSNLSNSTAIGSFAQVTASNALVLGSINGVNGATADTFVGIGTTAPAAKLDVHGNANFTGPISFAPGQTFPGAGTITGVTAGTDLLGGGTSGGVTLSVDTTKVVTGITAGTDLLGGGTGGVQTLNLDTTKVPQLAAANTFTNNQTVNGNLTATGVVSGSSYQIGSDLFAYGEADVVSAYVGFSGNPLTIGSGFGNTGVGYAALKANGGVFGNTAVGFEAMFLNTGGATNTAIGTQSLLNSTTGSSNTAVGSAAMQYNTTGGNNTALGATAGPDSGHPNLTNSTAIGANADVTASNALILGSTKGVNGATASTNVGIGTTAPIVQLQVQGNDNTGTGVQSLTNNISTSGNSFAVVATTSNAGVTNEMVADGLGTGPMGTPSGYFGTFTSQPIGLITGNAVRMFINSAGRVGIASSSPSNILTVGQGKGSAIADGWTTYSSRRWKTKIETLPDALAKVEQLRGVSYDLKQSGKHEIGVIAEEVGKVVPEVVSFEENGKDAMGVDYSRLTALLIEATKQQQALIRKQAQQIRMQQTQIRTQQRQIQAERTRGDAQQVQLARLASQINAIQASLKTITGTERVVRAAAVQPGGDGHAHSQ